MPMPSPQEPPAGANSSGGRQPHLPARPARGGARADLVTVLVSIQDEAQLQNTTEREREGTDSFGLPRLFGLESSITRILPNTVDPARLVQTNGAQTTSGTGSIRGRRR
jgi:flagellar L-ring protein precursor FlgH